MSAAFDDGSRGAAPCAVLQHPLIVHLVKASSKNRGVKSEAICPLGFVAKQCSRLPCFPKDAPKSLVEAYDVVLVSQRRGIPPCAVTGAATKRRHASYTATSGTEGPGHLNKINNAKLQGARRNYLGGISNGAGQCVCVPLADDSYRGSMTDLRLQLLEAPPSEQELRAPQAILPCLLVAGEEEAPYLRILLGDKQASSTMAHPPSNPSQGICAPFPLQAGRVRLPVPLEQIWGAAVREAPTAAGDQISAEDAEFLLGQAGLALETICALPEPAGGRRRPGRLNAEDKSPRSVLNPLLAILRGIFHPEMLAGRLSKATFRAALERVLRDYMASRLSAGDAVGSVAATNIFQGLTQRVLDAPHQLVAGTVGAPLNPLLPWQALASPQGFPSVLACCSVRRAGTRCPRRATSAPAGTQTRPSPSQSVAPAPRMLPESCGWPPRG
jgi:hypothetical protein